MKSNILLALSSIACAALLSACGGGGGGSSNASAEDIRQLTGLSPPTETIAAQRARSLAIVSRADSLIASTVHGETDESPFPTFTLGAQCSGVRCTLTEPMTGSSTSISIHDFATDAGSAEVIGSKYGITLQWQTVSLAGVEFRAYGAWMNHSGFTFRSETFSIDQSEGGARYGIVGGDLTGSAPTGSATWLGLMVGTPATGDRGGDRLQGVAALNLDLDVGSSIDVAFSSIVNIDRGEAHTTPTVLFGDVPVSSGGTFEAGFVGNRVQGGFYGPDHVEAAGIFEQSNIVGAFGANRQ